MNISIKQISSIGKNEFRRIEGYHKEHIAHNFPDSLYRPLLFRAQLAKDARNPRSSFFFGYDSKTKEIAGFLWLKLEIDPYKNPRPYRYLDLHYIHVDPVLRGKGVGSKFMRFVIETARKKHCREIRLGTHANNAAAQALYIKFGFAPYRIIFKKHL